MKRLNKALALSTLLLISNLPPALADSSVTLSDRLYLDSTDTGKLTVSNRYLTNYIMRVVDPVTGKLGGMRFIKPSDKAIDFDIVDIDFDGIIPKTNLSYPAKAPEETEIDLNSAVSDWRNADLVFQGASLVDMSYRISSGRLSKTEVVDTIILFALNALTLTKTSISVVHDLDTAGLSEAGELVSKLKPWAEKIANFQDEIAKLGLLSDVSQTWLDIADLFLNELDQDLSAYPGLADFRQYHLIFNESLNQLKVVAGITKEITAGQQQKIKGTIANQYKRLLKDLPVDLSNTSVDTVLDLAANEFAVQYRDATTGREQAELIALYFIQPMEKTLILFRTEFQRQLKQLERDKAPASEIKAKQEEIDSLRNGRALLLLSNMAFNAPEVMRKIREEPEFIVPFLWEVGAAVADEVFTLDTTETVVKKAWQQYTKLDGRHASFVKIRKTFKKSGSYMKAVSAGSTIGNRLLPLVWDIVLAPSRLQTSFINGQFSPYGPMETLVAVAKIDTATGEEKFIGGVNHKENEVALSLSAGDRIRIQTGLRRSLQFDPSRAPWELNPSVVPTTVYDVLTTSPESYSHTYLCARKLMGNIDYAFYDTVGTNWLVLAKQCGTGVSDFDLLGLQFPSTGGDWYDGSRENSTPYNPNELPEWLKIQQFTTSTNPINSLDYEYKGGKETLQVIVSGLSTNNIVHNILLVPELQQVGFKMSEVPGDGNSFAATFDASQILASPEDPIKSYTWRWGDSDIVSVSAEPKFQHEYAKSGSYDIRLTVTTESGAVTVHEESVVIGEGDAPVLQASPGDSTITLTWNSVTNAESYNLYYAKETMGNPSDVDNYSAYSGGTMLTGLSGNRQILHALNNNSTYYLTLVALVNGEESVPSNEVKAIPQALGENPVFMNDTGVTWGGNFPDSNNEDCTGETILAQDCSHGRDVTHNDSLDGHAGFSFTRINSDGSQYSGSGDYSSQPWSCVQDNVTGLMWEVKTTASEGADIHSRFDRHSWYNSKWPERGEINEDADICTGFEAKNPATYCNTESFVARVNKQGLCGYNDWRLPSPMELQSILDYGQTIPPLLDKSYFPNTAHISAGTRYWTDTHRAGSIFAIKVVEPVLGQVSTNQASNTSYAYTRLVRDNNSSAGDVE